MSQSARFEATIMATPESISDLTDRVMTFLDDGGVESRATHHTALVLSEVLTNLGTHGNCRERPAKIAVTIAPDQVAGEIVDSGPPFDPRLASDPSVGLSADERPVGGLGLYLVRQLSGSLEYTRLNDENYTRFVINRAQRAQPDAQA